MRGNPVKIEVLDHGYVELIEPYGHGKDGVPEDEWDGTKPDYEVGIVEAARQSTQGSFRGWDQDAKLLRYLHDHKHATPFEFAGMVIEVRAPIFVLREWHRHRTQSYNEMSARYTPLPDLYYVPTVERLMAHPVHVTKQAGAVEGIPPLTQATAQDAQDLIRRTYDLAEAHYRAMLLAGVPKELARVVMPVGHYTQMRAAASLRNWLSFLTLRLDQAAQHEIREYARAVGQLIAATFPRTWALFSLPATQEGQS
jgi:thymidylate synthase (FAD)